MTSPLKLEHQIEATIQSRRMLIPGDRVAVAVSGGPDSVGLLSILQSLKSKWGFRILAIHLDHGLRGIYSREDAQFVKQICHHLQIALTIEKLDLKKATARQKGLSLQEYAREARYEVLLTLANKMGATKIALGHTADDQVETVLMWMIRGAGTKGLGGIQPTRRPYFIRPMLGVSRSEILAYLASRELEYRVDHSNLQPIYLRNRIRLELIPILKRYNPSLVKVLSRQADIVREEDGFLDQLAIKSLKQTKVVSTEVSLVLDRTRLLALPLTLRRRVVRLAIQRMTKMIQGPRFDSVESVLNRVVEGQSGKWVMVHGIRIGREYDAIQFQELTLGTECVEPYKAVNRAVPIPSQVIWPLTGQTLDITLRKSPTFFYQTESHQALLDAETFTPLLIIRTWQPGDQFYPLGLYGKRKKLQDFFSDIRLERSKRSRVPLLVAPEGILWVGGYRLDHRFRVTESTHQVLAANLSPVSN